MGREVRDLSADDEEGALDAIECVQSPQFLSRLKNHGMILIGMQLTRLGASSIRDEH